MRKTFSIVLAMTVLLLAGQAWAQTSIVVAQDDSPRMMNPHGDDSDAGLQYFANFFDGLLQRKGPEGILAPALAVKWERQDALNWKFWLRQGVTFHNGNPFTAEDVKFTFERLSNPEVSEFVNAGKSIDGITIHDDYTLTITTKEPIPWFINNLHQTFIVDKEDTTTRDPGDVMVRPMGTGAYKFVEWVKGSYVKMEANENYWEGAPPIKKVEIRPITESSTRFAALVSGQVGMLTGVPVELYDQVKKNSQLEIVSKPARRSIFLALANTPGTPTADIRVRQAIYMAINEDEIIEKVMRGQASPAAQIPDQPTIGYVADLKRLSYNPDKAKQLLKEAGYEQGFPITLSGPNDRYIQDAKIVEAVAKYLAKVGIQVTLDVKPKSIFFPEVNQGKLPFYLIGWFDGTFDMGRTYYKLAHSRDKERGFGELNGASYSDPEIDALIESTAGMLDAKVREKALQDLNKMAMVDKITWIPLHYQMDVYAVRKDSKLAFQPRPDRWMIYKELSIK
jgi:peptide/nickel transport system substrate-binding protein